MSKGQIVSTEKLRYLISIWANRNLVCFFRMAYVLSADSHLSTYQISTFVDNFIRPYVQTLPAYIRDSTDFIEKCSSLIDLPDYVVLLTIDITSLYTSVAAL